MLGQRAAPALLSTSSYFQTRVPLSPPPPFLAPLPSDIPAASSTFNPLRLLAGVRLVQTDRFSLSLSRRAKDQIRYIPHRRNPMMIYIALYSTLDPSNRSSISLARIPRCIECLVETFCCIRCAHARRSEKKILFYRAFENCRAPMYKMEGAL